MYKKTRFSHKFMNKICARFLVHYVSFYLIFSPIFSSKVLAQSLPINPVGGTTMGTPSNNIPVLNIAKPSEAGVSVNKFKDFNVGQEGLIVNNLNLQDYNFNYKSELSGGHVEFNPNFRDGDYAKVILNEVVSGNPTSLLGTTEIYGRKADYIVANPNGITCAGCGFINTSRLSLITGSSNIKNGEIESFTISPTGILRINGVGVSNLGLYAPSPADLVSNAIQIISGEVQTYGDLRIFQGNKEFDWKNLNISSDDKVESNIAVDMSAMGAMKANNIYVIATSNGFGVNLNGDLVSAGNIEITADGNIGIKNASANNSILMKSSSGNIETKTGGEVFSNDTIYAQSKNGFIFNGKSLLSNDVYLISNGDFTNNTNINSNNELFISAGNFINNANIISDNILEISLTDNFINNSSIAAKNEFSIFANSLTNNSNIFSKDTLDISLNGDFFNNGSVISDADLSIVGNNLVNTSNITSHKNLELFLQNDFVNNSKINSEGYLFITSNNFTNTSEMLSKDVLDIETKSNFNNLQNSKILSYKDLFLNILGNLTNIGKINSSEFLSVNANNIHNYGQILSVDDMEIITKNDLINYRGSGILSGGNLLMKIANNLINYKAEIYANKDLVIEGNEDVEDKFNNIDDSKTYDNPYIEKEVDLNDAKPNIFDFDDNVPDDEDVSLVLILIDTREKIEIAPDAFPEDAKAGDKIQYGDYTIILGKESFEEVYVDNPEYKNCVGDECVDIPEKIKVKKAVYTESTNEEEVFFTIKDANGNNMAYAENMPEADPNNDQIIPSGSEYIYENTLDAFKKVINDYNFKSNVLNNFVNYAGRVEAKGNIEINANNITNKAFTLNENNPASISYHKIRNEACGWICGWKMLGYDEITGINLNGIPGNIVSGGKLVLNALSRVDNISSVISSKGDMLIKSPILNNITTSKEVLLAIKMQQIKIKRKKLKISKHHYNKTEYDRKRVYSKQRSSIVAGGNLSIASTQVINDQNLNPENGIVTTVKDNNIKDSVITVDVQLPVGDNGLFKVSDNDKYLVETNVPFINVADYIGSDYFFKGNGTLFTGVDTIKIIGDPAYETKLVMDAIVKATGENYLKNDGSIGSYTEQMKALYDNATEIYEEFGLKVGVALTEDQISALHKDIIWYVEREVNGEKVLVPELYLSQATLDDIDDNKGSKITGFNVGIESDFVSNYGDIKSENLLSIDTKTLLNSGNDENAAKIISAGGVKINADNVLNLSGTISGDVVQIDADNIVNQTKVLSDDYEGPNVKRHTEIAGSTSTISGENGVSLNAKNTLVNSGANIESTNGDVMITADTAIFDSIALRNKEEISNTHHDFMSKTKTTEVTESVKNQESLISGKNISIITNGEFLGRGISMNAENDIEINANSVTFEEVFDSYYTMIKKEKSSLDIASAVAFVGAASIGGAFTAIMASTTALQMRKKKIKTTEKYDEEAVNNTLSANNISINSNKDVEMRNTDIIGNIESSMPLNNITVYGKHEHKETVSRSGGKWWKAGIAGLAVGLTSRFILKSGVNLADKASTSIFGEGTSHFTQSVINMANSMASIFGKTYLATTMLGLNIELGGSSLIESTIISPTLGKYND